MKLEKAIDGMFTAIYFPWSQIRGSQPLPTRALLFLAGLVWALPAFVLLGVPLVLLIFVEMANTIINDR